MLESKARSFEWAEDDLLVVIPDIAEWSQLTWRDCYAEILPKGLDYFVFDCALHVGTDVALIWLRNVLGLTQAPLVDTQLVAAIKEHDPEILISGIEMLWRRRLKSSKDWFDVGRKQTNHVNRVKHRALKLIFEDDLVPSS